MLVSKTDVAVLWSGSTGGVPGAEQTTSGAILRGIVYVYIAEYSNVVSDSYYAVLNDGSRYQLGSEDITGRIRVTSLGIIHGRTAGVSIETLDGSTAVLSLVRETTYQYDDGTPEPPVIPPQIGQVHVAYWHPQPISITSGNWKSILAEGAGMEASDQHFTRDPSTHTVVVGSNEYNRILTIGLVSDVTGAGKCIFQLRDSADNLLCASIFESPMTKYYTELSTFIAKDLTGPTRIKPTILASGGDKSLSNMSLILKVAHNI